MHPGIRGDHSLVIHTHLAGAGRVIGAFNGLANKGINLFVRLNLSAGLNLQPTVFVHCRLVDDIACQAHAVTEALPIVFVLQIVELDLWRLARIVRLHVNGAATFGLVMANV